MCNLLLLGQLSSSLPRTEGFLEYGILNANTMTVPGELGLLVALSSTL